MSVFGRSLAALVYLYQRDKRNYDNLFELGQVEFWIGYWVNRPSGAGHFGRKIRVHE